eukprot:7290699-Prorocentrum_lima.AAC.1
MTSSLVGSEMCIRDSLNSLCRCLCRARAAAVSVVMVMVNGHRLAVRAVSYTHLTLPTICSV